MKNKLLLLLAFVCLLPFFSKAQVGNALNFDGSNDYVLVPDAAIDNLASGTIESWIYLNSNNEEVICVKQHDGVGTYANFSIGCYSSIGGLYTAGVAGKIYFHAANWGPSEAASVTNLSTGQWYHVAVTFDNISAKIYINGVLDNSAAGNYSVPSDLASTGTAIGGWLGGGGGRYFNGNIDEFRVWNTVRTQPQIAADIYSDITAAHSQWANLLAYYKFNTGTSCANNTGLTTATDTKGSYNGTLTNFALNTCTSNWILSTFSKPFGNALDLVGSASGGNDYVTIPDNSTLDLQNTYTIEAWVYVTDATNNTIIDKGNYNYLFQTHPNGNTGLGLYNNTMGWKYSAGVVPSNTWSHVAVTFNLGSNEVKFYLNGSLLSTHNGISNQTLDNAEINIGRQSPSTCQCNLFDGKIDELRVWNTVRTQTNIQTDMYSFITSAHSQWSNLKAYYRFDQGSAGADNTGLPNEAIDYSGNCNTGTLTNFALTGATSNWAYPGNAEAPVLTTTSATGVTFSTATFNGTVFSEGESNVTIRGFQYSTNACLTSNLVSVSEAGSWGPGPVSYSLSPSGNLGSNTTYYYRSFATNTQGTSYGEVQSFTTSAFTPLGNALDFDGTNDYLLSSNNVDFGGNITFEAWIKTSLTNDWEGLVANQEATLNHFLQLNVTSTGYLRAQVYTPSGNRYVDATTTFIRDNNWHHVACTFSAATQTINIYADGVLQSLNVGSSVGVVSDLNVTGKKLIVGGARVTGFELRATFDEVRAWNIERSQAQIQADMYSYITSAHAQWPNLKACYRFDQGSAGADNTGLVNEAIDYSGNCNKGTFTNMARIGATSNWVYPGNLEAPILSTTAASAVTFTTATLNGNIFSLGETALTTRGFCYATTDCPTTANSIVNEAVSVTGTFNLGVTGLSPNTTYYYRAYATNSKGTSYGEVQSFITFIPLGNAIDFDGSNDAISVPDNNNLDFTNKYTFESWIYVKGYQYGTFVSKFDDDGNNRGWMISMGETGDPTKITVCHSQLGTWTNPIQWNSGFTPALNTWYHMAVVYDGTLGSNNIKLYLNGTFINQATWAFSTTANAANVLIGGYDGSGNGLNAGSNSRFINAKMDEVRLWNTARTQAEISANCTSYLAGNEAGLKAYYRFDQGDAGNNNAGRTSAIDYSGNCNTGTLNGPFALTGATSNWVHPGNLEAPVLTTTAATGVTYSTATFNGNIFSIGETDVTTRGFQYATNSCLTANLVTVSETGTYAVGSFNLPPSSILGSNTTYYYRSFATNTQGTSYGEVVSFTTAIFTPLGNALDFDGTNDYVDCGNILAPSYTKEAWVYISNMVLGDNFISGGTADGKHAFFAPTGYGNKLSAGHNDVWTSVQDPVALVVNTWYHVAVTYDAPTTTMKLYKNGSLVSTNTGVPAYNSGNRVRIGTYGVTNFVGGKMDEVRVWNVVRTQAEIQAGMYSYITTMTGLTAYYRFDQGDAGNDNTALPNEVIDYTGNCNKGTLSGPFTLNGGSSNWVNPGNDEAPVLTTAAATAVLYDGATLNGNIFSIGETVVTTRGFCYSTSDCPTLSNSLINESGSYGAGTFSLNITGLTGNTTYYYRTYATNAQGTSYGETNSFTTPFTPQTITFSAIPNKYVDDAPFTLTAVATSGLPVSFSVVAGGAVATVLGNTVTLTFISGQVTIKASQPGNINYAAAPDVYRTFTVSKIANTVTLDYIPNKYVNDLPFFVTASATNGPIVFASTDPTVATIDAGTGEITIVGAGFVSITASVPASASYLDGFAFRNFTVKKLTNSVSLASIPVKNITDAPFSVTASATSGPIGYSSSNTAVATINAVSGLVTITGAGSTLITAAVPATANYLAGSSSRTLVVKKPENTISLSTIPGKYVTDVPFVVSATANNGTISFSSSNPAVATINSVSGLVTIVASGNTIITASVPESANYLAGTASRSLSVSKLANNVTLASIPGKTVTDIPFLVSATATNGTLSYTSSNTGVATINPVTGLVTIMGAGSTNITASVPVSASYLAGSATKMLTVNKLTNIVTLASLPSKYVTDLPFLVSATATNGTISFSSSNIAVATINSVTGLVTIVGVGTTILTASVPASSNYLSGSASRTLTVKKQINTVTLSSIPSKFVSDVPFLVSATATSGTISYSSSNTGVATINSVSGLVTIVGAGTTSIMASVPASPSYLAGSASKTLTVKKLSNTVTLASIPAKFITDVPFLVSATATNGTIGYSSSNTAVATINPVSGLITIVGSGNTTITATVPASTNYLSGTATTTLTVKKLPNAVTLASIPAKYVTDVPFLVSATATDGTISYTSSNSGVATINSLTGLVTIVGAGNTTITASVSASANYLGGSASKILTVKKLTNVVTLANIPAKYITDVPFSVSATANNGTISYTSSNTGVATINAVSGLVTIVGVGTTSITASVPSNSTYLAGSATKSLSVNKLVNTITLDYIPAKLVNDVPFSVTATATNGTIAFTSSNTSVATINSVSGLVTLVGVGTTTIQASVPASANYLAGTATRQFTVKKLSNTVILASIPAKYVTDVPFLVSATATDGIIGYFSSNTTVATINSLSGLVTIVGAGTTTITAAVPASANYLAGSASKSLTVKKLMNTVTLAAIPIKYVTDVPFLVSATASDGTITYTSSNTSVATINSVSGLVTIVGAGTTSIKASVPVSATYLAGSATKSLTVKKLTNTITFAPIGTKYLTDPPFAVSAIPTNGTISYSSTNTSVATIDAGTGVVTLVGAGSCTIKASVPASVTYLAGFASRPLQVIDLSSAHGQDPLAREVFDENDQILMVQEQSDSKPVELEIFPNPSSGIIFIMSDRPIQVTSVYSLTGELVSSEKLPGLDNNSLDMGRLPKGIYFIHFSFGTDQPDIVRKVVLE